MAILLCERACMCVRAVFHTLASKKEVGKWNRTVRWMEMSALKTRTFLFRQSPGWHFLYNGPFRAQVRLQKGWLHTLSLSDLQEEVKDQHEQSQHSTAKKPKHLQKPNITITTVGMHHCNDVNSKHWSFSRTAGYEGELLSVSFQKANILFWMNRTDSHSKQHANEHTPHLQPVKNETDDTSEMKTVTEGHLTMIWGYLPLLFAAFVRSGAEEGRDTWLVAVRHPETQVSCAANLAF